MPPRPAPRHDHDAASGRALLGAKAELREEVWAAMTVPGIRRFPNPDGHIPNFVGAEAAARQLAGTTEWTAASTVMANPDSSKLPVRFLALEAGKTVFMVVPRLAADKPFFLLDPAALADTPYTAASIKGASRSAPDGVVRCLRPREHRPPALDWSELTAGRIAAIPLLRRLQHGTTVSDGRG